MPNLLSGRTLVTPSSKLSPSRYTYVSLKQAQPALGKPTVDNSILLSRLDGTTYWISQDILLVGPSTKNVLYVTKTGKDTNDGTSIIKAKSTIVNALAIATPGTTILVSSGEYNEINPIRLPVDVSILGQDSKVTVIPKNPELDVFNLNSGSNIQGITVVNHKSPSFAFSILPNAKITVAPIIKNCSSITGPFLKDGTLFVPFVTIQNPIITPGALPLLNADVPNVQKRIDPALAGGGINADGSVFSSTSLIKLVTVDNFTAINQGGIGILAQHNATINAKSSTASFCYESFKAIEGGYLNLQSCESDYGTYGLVSDGFQSVPYIANGSVSQTQYSYIQSIAIIEGGTGYSIAPDVQIDPPTEVGGIQATATAEISGGIVTAVNIVEQGSGYATIPSITFIGSNTTEAQANAILSGVSQVSVTSINYKPLSSTIVKFTGNPNYQFVTFATNLISSTSTVSIVPSLYFILQDTVVNFYNSSKITANGHTFNYVGSGVTYNALSENGGVSVQANEVSESNYGKVYFTSLSETGSYKIGNQFEINQLTGTSTINAGSLDLTNISSIGPFIRNGAPVGVKLKEVSDNISLISSTGAIDNFTAPTQHAVSAYLQNNYLPLTGGIVTGSLTVENLKFENNAIYSTEANQNIVISPSGSGIIDVSNSRIKNLVDPILDQDAATKHYVDLVASGGTQVQNPNFQDSLLRIHKPSVGWLTSDDGKDSGLLINYFKNASTVVVTGGSSNGSTATLTYNGPSYIVGSMINVDGVTPASFNGIAIVTASSAGSVSYENLVSDSVVTSGSLGVISQTVSLDIISGTSTGYTATIIYNGPTLLDDQLVTIANLIPVEYNGTFNVTNVSAGQFDITTLDFDIGPITTVGTISIDNRKAFSGWANNSESFEFYKEGAETDNNVFEGIYGDIAGAAFVAKMPSSISSDSITAGSALRIPSSTIYNNSTAASSTLSLGSIVNIGHQTIDAVNTSITYTDAASLYIANAPTAGSNVAITNSYALQIAEGNTFLGGNLIVNGGNITTLQSTFNLINTDSTTINAFGAASTINIGSANTTVTIGKTTGNNTLRIAGNGTSGIATLSTTTGVTTANVFNTLVTSGNLFGAATTVNIASVGTNARSIGIATSATNSASTLTFGGAVTNNTLKISSITSGTVNLTTDVTSGIANIFPSIIGVINVGSTAATVNIGNNSGNSILEVRGSSSAGTATIRTNSGVTSATVFNSVTTGNIFNNAISINLASAASSASTLTLGSAVTNNTLKISSITSGTVNLTTDVTTGTANIFAGVLGTVTIGGNTINSGNGIVKLGISPSQYASNNEVVTAEWVLNSLDPSTQTVELTSLDANQLIETGFDWGVYRSAKYTIQGSQIGDSGTRAQTSEILLTTDAPVYTVTGAASTGSSKTIMVSSTIGLYVGMTVRVTSGTGEFAANSIVTTIIPNTSFMVSLAPVNALSAASITAVLSGTYTSLIGATNSGTTVTVTNTSKLYPGMAVSVTSGTGTFFNNTYVVSITNSTTFVISHAPTINLSNGAVITGYPNVYITEYAAIETNGTLATINADVNSTNVILTASPNTASTCKVFGIGNINKTLFKLKKQLIELT